MESLNDKLNTLNKKAYDMFLNKNYSEVVPVLEELINIIPKADPNYRNLLAHTYSNLGYTYYRANDYKKAEPLFKESIDIDATVVQSYQSLLQIYMDSDRNDEAMELSLKEVQNNPYSSTAWTDSAQLWVFLTEPESALRYLRRAVALNNDNIRAWSLFAKTYSDMGDFTSSQNAIQETYRCANTTKLEDTLERQALIDAMQVDSGIKMIMERYDEALKVCEMLRQFEPKEQWSYTIAAYISRIRQDFPSALTVTDAGLRIAPNSSNILFVRALSLLDMRLEKDYEKALANITDPVLYHATKARGLLNREHLTESLDEALKSLTCKEDRDTYRYLSLAKTENRYVISRAIALYVKKHSFRDLIKEVRESLVEKGNLTSINYVLSALVEYSGAEKKYVRMSHELFREALKNKPGVMKTPKTASKNTVQIIAVNEVATNVYMLKTCPQDTPENRVKIEREYKLTRFVNSIAPSLSSEAVLLEQPYMLQKWIRVPSLSEIEKNSEVEELEKEIKKCINTMTLIHEDAFPIKISEKEFCVKYYDDYDEQECIVPLQRYDFLSELNRRFAARCGGDARRVISEYSRLLQKIDLEEHFIHGDAFRGNWLKGGIVIDWERACIGDSMQDLVQLVNDIEFADLNKSRLLEYYVTRRKSDERIVGDISFSINIVGQDGTIFPKNHPDSDLIVLPYIPHENEGLPLHRTPLIDSQKIIEKYNILSIHDSICNIGTRMDRRDHPGVQAYFEQAMQQTQKYPELQKELIDYLRSAGLVG